MQFQRGVAAQFRRRKLHVEYLHKLDWLKSPSCRRPIRRRFLTVPILAGDKELVRQGLLSEALANT